MDTPTPSPGLEPAKPRRREAYAEKFARGDSYGLLLVLLLGLYVVIAATEHTDLWSRWAISLMLGAVMLLALHTSHVRSRGFHIGVGIVVLAETVGFLQALFNERTGSGVSFLMFALVLAAPIVILNRILRHDVVGLETILGAICVYVLIAIAFSGLYGWINEVSAQGFFAQDINPRNIDFLYFSFVTITTVGYGDLTAGGDVGRIVVTFEALIGQIFLVTLVARLVGMYGAHVGPRRPDPGARDADDADGSDLPDSDLPDSDLPDSDLPDSDLEE